MNFGALTENVMAVYVLGGAGAFALIAAIGGVFLAKKYPNEEHKGIHQVLAEKQETK